jgi:hypothetical protein
MIVHLVLGATRADLLKAAVLEGLLVGGIASVLALIVAWPAAFWVNSVMPETLLLLDSVGFDWVIVAVVCIVGCITVTTIGVVASMRLPSSGMPLGEPVGSRPMTTRLAGGTVLLGCLIATVNVVVIVGTGMVASYVRANAAALGYDPYTLIALGVNSTSTARGTAVLEVSDRVGGLPGVTAVAGWTGRLLEAVPRVGPAVAVPAGWSGSIAGIEYYGVTQEFFDVIDLPVTAGALPTRQTWRTESVAVVSGLAARKFWPGGDPVGQQLISLRHDRAMTPYSIVAVVGEARYHAADVSPVGAIYLPADLVPASTSGELLIRTAPPALDLLPTIRSAVEGTGAWRVAWAATGSQLTSASLRVRRLRLGLAGSFAVIALFTLGVGILGLILLELKHRSRELAIRLCLGARTADIAWLLGKGIAVPLVSGLVAGLVVARMANDALTPYLLGYEPTSTLLVGSAGCAVTLTAGFAAMTPAIRWTRAYPLARLRADV